MKYDQSSVIKDIELNTGIDLERVYRVLENFLCVVLKYRINGRNRILNDLRSNPILSLIDFLNILFFSKY